MGLQTRPLAARIAAVGAKKSPTPPAVTPINPTQVAVSSSEPGHAPYIHSYHGDGVFTCRTVENGQTVVCPGFLYRGTCRHHTAALPFLPEEARPVVRRCVTCRTDAALPNGEQCEGCAHVYPHGQEVAERESLVYCVHGQPGGAHCVQCWRVAHDPVEARHRALTAQHAGSRLFVNSPAGTVGH